MSGTSQAFWAKVDFFIDLVMLPFRVAFWFVAITLRAIFSLKS
jgi:hypothetical protein